MLRRKRRRSREEEEERQFKGKRGGAIDALTCLAYSALQYPKDIFLPTQMNNLSDRWTSKFCFLKID